MKFKKYILLVTVFFSGFIVMVFELIGSRILGPFIGTSIFVWTSLIGVILASLSLGYYLGGKTADKNPNLEKLSSIFFLAAFFMSLTFIFKDILLVFLQLYVRDIKISSIISSLLLFAPASVFFGMVSPYVIRLRIVQLEDSGSIIGNLFAISTFGSILGTFSSGFFLIPFLGVNNVVIILIVISIFISIIIFPRWSKLWKYFLILFFLLIGVFFGDSKNFLFGIIEDIDTTYSRVLIREYREDKTNRKVRSLSINNENSSAMFLDSEDLVYEYTKYYSLAEHFAPDFKKTLMLGGAGYSFPKYFLRAYPEATVDVVEIDPMLTEISKKYFNLKNSSRLNIYHQDARVFLNNSNEKYDVIFGDAFNSHYSIPYQLTTKEAVQKEFDLLGKDGVVILNVISSIEGSSGKFLRAEYRTYKSIFPQVLLFPVEDFKNGKLVQNIILVALKSNKPAIFFNKKSDLNKYLQHLWRKEIILDIPILTDDLAPVSYYVNEMDLN